MFGTQDKNDNQPAPAEDQPVGSDVPSLDSPVSAPPAKDEEKPAEEAPFNPFPTMITDDSASDPALDAPVEPPAEGAPEPPPQMVAEPTTTLVEPETAAPKKKGHKDKSPTPAAGQEELLEIKQQALQELTPLVDKLELAPEEKFRTTMMLLQATDNQSLLKDAHEAALVIEDEKIRAQALLDVVNEANYFIQQKES